MSGIKQLAGQTFWYGASSIAARFINYLLTPYLTLKFSDIEYGEMSVVYAFIPFMNIIFTYGMETAFFRFAKEDQKEKVYQTAQLALLISSIVLGIILIGLKEPLNILLKIEAYPQLLTLAALIIVVDALSTIPFAKLRLEGKPKQFALIKISSICLNIGCVYFFISYCPQLLAKNTQHWIGTWYNPNWKVGYILLANLIQSIFTLLLLSKYFIQLKFQFDIKLFQQMLSYGWPLIIAGFAGMINETFDRLMLNWWAPVTSLEAAKAEVGIYSACYKLSILITLGIQAFRMGAEPFFFKQASKENAQLIYAKVMKYFVITLCFMFLGVAMLLDVWKYFILNPKLWVGLKVVPILLLANIFLGIYYNLSVWYKLSNQTMAGAYITLMGAAITLLINYLFIPHYSYMACAWATFTCYGLMMIVSFLWGQKVYPIPYVWKKLLAYILIVVLLFALQQLILLWVDVLWVEVLTAVFAIIVFGLLILKVEGKELSKLFKPAAQNF